jgi:hypothetical protein
MCDVHRDAATLLSCRHFSTLRQTSCKVTFQSFLGTSLQCRTNISAQSGDVRAKCPTLIQIINVDKIDNNRKIIPFWESMSSKLPVFARRPLMDCIVPTAYFETALSCYNSKIVQINRVRFIQGALIPLGLPFPSCTKQSYGATAVSGCRPARPPHVPVHSRPRF